MQMKRLPMMFSGAGFSACLLEQLSRVTRTAMSMQRKGTRGPVLRVMALAAGLALVPACLRSLPGSGGSLETSPAPWDTWRPRPADVTSPAEAVPPVLPRDLLESRENWSIATIVDIALRNSPETRAAWAEARAAAAEFKSRQGAYYPSLDLNTHLTYGKGSAVGGRLSYEQTTYGPYAELNYLLFNFGARKASVEEGRQALLAANWMHNSAILDTVLGVERAYYEYLYNLALEQSQEAALKETQTSLDAAGERHKAGVATIADVLQAKTAYSQALLTMETVRGRVYVTRGSLATAMGLPASTVFEVEPLPETLPLISVSEKVEEHLEEARQKRPDLAAARSEALQARANLTAVRRDLFPSLSAAGSAGRDYYEQRGGHSDEYLASVTMDFPLFRGFSRLYDIHRAEAQSEAAGARLSILEQNAALQVWMSYYSFKTAEQQLTASDDLLESAQQSYEVALGSYKAGVGSILDLLSAQSVLARARAQHVEARAFWLISIAQLAHDTGNLWLQEPPGAGSAIGPGEGTDPKQ